MNTAYKNKDFYEFGREIGVILQEVFLAKKKIES